jgi:hypothetical protein
MNNENDFENEQADSNTVPQMRAAYNVRDLGCLSHMFDEEEVSLHQPNSGWQD